ncbi:MAG TPA: hypothetical protein VI894_04050, partial [Candidatus Nanoarchaeia archaeon]|nr:hypothetical protein [Candidatus Nanoarchaeia archaeon]
KKEPAKLQPFFASILTKKPITAVYRDVRITGEFIFCPAYTSIILQEKEKLMQSQNPGKCLEEIVTWKKMREGAENGKGKGMEFIGLGAYTSIFDNVVRQMCGTGLSEVVDVHTTQGSSYTAMSAYLGIREASEKMGISLKDSVVSVVGAAGSIGTLFTQLIAPDVKVVNLVGRQDSEFSRKKLEQTKRIAESYAKSREKNPDIQAVQDYDILKKSDIVVCTTSSGGNLLRASQFKKGTILGNISVPSDLSDDVYNREDLLVAELGLNLVPENVDLGLTEKYHIELPPNVLYACAAQTICATLEKKSTGDLSIFKKLRESSIIRPQTAYYTKSLAEKYGFKTALVCKDRILGDNNFERVKRNAGRFVIGFGN